MPSRRRVILAVLLCASVVFLLFSLRSIRPPAAQARPQATSADEEKRTALAIPAAAPADVDFSRYQDLAKRNIFAERAPGGSPPKETRPGPPPVLPPFVPPSPPTPKLDLSGWSYLGYVVLDGKKLGILSQERSGRCEYVPVGGEFLGARVEDVNDQTIRFSFDSSQTTLSRARDFVVTPLEKRAAPAGPRPPPRPQ